MALPFGRWHKDSAQTFEAVEDGLALSDTTAEEARTLRSDTSRELSISEAIRAMTSDAALLRQVDLLEALERRDLSLERSVERDALRQMALWRWIGRRLGHPHITADEEAPAAATASA